MLKTKCKTGYAIALAAFAVLFVLAGNANAGSDSCTLVGTWLGTDGPDFTWMKINSPGSSATVGQLNLEWVMYNPTLGLEGYFPELANAVRWTNSKGVWEKVDKNLYKFMWVAYSLDNGGKVVSVARASGTKTMVSCDHVNISGVVELWIGNQDINANPPVFGFPIPNAVETRMPLVQVSQ